MNLACEWLLHLTMRKLGLILHFCSDCHVGCFIKELNTSNCKNGLRPAAPSYSSSIDDSTCTHHLMAILCSGSSQWLKMRAPGTCPFVFQWRRRTTTWSTQQQRREEPSHEEGKQGLIPGRRRSTGGACWQGEVPVRSWGLVQHGDEAGDVEGAPRSTRRQSVGRSTILIGGRGLRWWRRSREDEGGEDLGQGTPRSGRPAPIKILVVRERQQWRRMASESDVGFGKKRRRSRGSRGLGGAPPSVSPARL
ncbi:unnamed protein product [Urochloa humidicola]